MNSVLTARALDVAADGSGNWSAALPAFPPDDDLLPLAFGNSADGVCVRVLVQSVGAGGGELSAERCFVEAHLPLVLRQ